MSEKKAFEIRFIFQSASFFFNLNAGRMYYLPVLFAFQILLLNNKTQVEKKNSDNNHSVTTI